MGNESTLYRWFWQKMDALTASRPLSAADRQKYEQQRGEERLKRFLGNLDTLNEFLEEASQACDELERGGLDVAYAKDFLQRIRGPIRVLNTVSGFSQDAVAAAEETSRELAGWYHRAEREARAAAGGDDDQYFILRAAIDRLWQARNVKAVLGTQPGSFVMRLWPRWRDRIFALVF
jgi:hypothetical protein